MENKQEKQDPALDLLKEIQKKALAFQAIYPDKTIQIQINDLTFEFILIYLTAYCNANFDERVKGEEKLFGFDVLTNKRLKKRYAIAILEEEEGA